MSNGVNNPADWDDWGSTPTGDAPQSDDTWGSPNTDNTWGNEQSSWDDLSQPQQQEDDIWGSNDTWGQQSQDSFIPQDNQGTFIPQDNQGTFIPQDDMTQSFQNFDDSGDLTAQVQQQPVKFNFGTKKAALILAGAILLLAVILMIIDSIKITPKPTQQPQAQQQQVQQSTPQQQTTPQPQQSSVGTSQGSAVLVEVPDSMDISYSGDIQEANGKVISKKKYVQGHQILYCITINITFGSSSENVSYYCNYNSYNQVSVGDVVVITYQQVNDNYISVNAIQK